MSTAEALFGLSAVVLAIWLYVAAIAIPPIVRAHPQRSPLLLGLLIISCLEVLACVVLLETAGHAFGSHRHGIHMWWGPFTLRGINAAIAAVVWVMIRKART